MQNMKINKIKASIYGALTIEAGMVGYHVYNLFLPVVDKMNQNILAPASIQLLLLALPVSMVIPLVIKKKTAQPHLDNGKMNDLINKNSNLRIDNGKEICSQSELDKIMVKSRALKGRIL